MTKTGESPNGNCLYSSVSLLLFWNNLHVDDLTESPVINWALIKFNFLPCFFLSEHTSWSEKYFFLMSIKNNTIDSDLQSEEAVKFEVVSNCRDKEWSSFLCLLAVSSVIKRKIFSHFPDCGDKIQKLLRNQIISPREECLSDTPLHILFCKLGGLNLNQQKIFQANHFVPLIQFISQKRKQISKLNLVEIKRSKTGKQWFNKN